MLRRTFLGSSAAAFASLAQDKPPVKFGLDLFSIRSQGWNAFEYLDYCAKWKFNVVHFSEIRFLGSLEPAHLQRVAERAKQHGIEIEIGMMSICPSSKRFDRSKGTAEEQITTMIAAAKTAGSRIVRCVLGSAEDRVGPVPIEGHIENTVKVLKAVRSRVQDSGLKIAIENHAGDMQARELKALVEEAGKDFVGVCLDSGNPLWAIEDPNLTLETLAPYALTSHIRDSAVWKTEKGAAVRWVRGGEGNVGIEDFMRRYTELCPGRALSLEVIVTGPRMFNYLEPKFWDAYRRTPGWEFARFLALAEKGKPQPPSPPVPRDQAAQREREDLEASIAHARRVLNLA